MKPTLLVLAAGMGTRYGGNKQLDEVGPSGETIIDYSIYDAIRAGFGKIVFVIRRDIEEQVKERFVKRLKGKVEVDYVFQEVTNVPAGSKVTPERIKPWGTSHAVMVADKIKEPFGVINADDYYGFASYQILNDFLVNNKDPNCYCIVGYKMGNTLSDHGTVNRGVCNVDKGGLLKNIVEVLKIEKTPDGAKAPDPAGGAEVHYDGSEIVSMNLFGFKPSFFDFLHEDFSKFIEKNGMDPKSELLIPATLDRYIKKGTIRIQVLMSNEKWFGVTYREDKPFVVENISRMIREGVYPKSLY